MKRIFFTILFGLIGIVASAQEIYSVRQFNDKYDDIEYRENVKTIFNINYDKIVVDSKGYKPFNFIILNSDGKRDGDKDNIVNLNDNIYGYAITYYCLLEEDSILLNSKYWIEYYNTIGPESDDKEELIKIFKKDENAAKKVLMMEVILNEIMGKDIKDPIYEITIKTITSPSGLHFIDRLFWIKKNDGSRIIYMKK